MPTCSTVLSVKNGVGVADLSDMQDEARSKKILHDINLAKCGGSTQLFLNYCKISDLLDVLIQDQ